MTVEEKHERKDNYMDHKAYCRVEVSDRDSQAHELLRERGFSEDGPVTYRLVFEDKDAIFGGYHTKQALISEKIPFVGYQSESEDDGFPPSMVFAFDGELYAEAIDLFEVPVAFINTDGEVDPSSLKAAVEYYAVDARAHSHIKGFDYRAVEATGKGSA